MNETDRTLVNLCDYRRRHPRPTIPTPPRPFRPSRMLADYIGEIVAQEMESHLAAMHSHRVG